MRIAKSVRRNILLTIISVIVVTLLTVRVAYSAVFAVKSEVNVQEITSGNLSVVIDNTNNNSSPLSLTKLMPTASENLPSSTNLTISDSHATLTLNNEGTLDSAFSVSITYDALPQGKTLEDVVSFDNLLIGIYNNTSSEWVTFNGAYYKQISSITPSGTNEYPILRDTLVAPALNGSSSKQYYIYVWLKEDTPIDEIGKLAYLKLNVKSKVVNDGVSNS